MLDNYIRVTKQGIPLVKDKDEKKDIPTKKKGSRRYDKAKDMLQNDNQLRDCIVLISMLNTAQLYTPNLVKNRADALTYLKQNYIGSDQLEIEEVTL